jgi:hypothetical protein
MCASGVRPTGWTRPHMRPSGRGPPGIAKLSSRWPGCSADSRSPRRVTGSGNEAGVPFNHKRASCFGRGNHAALRTNWSSGRLKPMDDAGRRSHRGYGCRRSRADSAPDGHCDAQEGACKKAVTPGTSTMASLAIRLVLSCSAAMFQVPVTTRTAKGGPEGRHLIEPACHSKRDLRSQARCQIEATPGGKRASAHAGRN